MFTKSLKLWKVRFYNLKLKFKNIIQSSMLYQSNWDVIDISTSFTKTWLGKVWNLSTHYRETVTTQISWTNIRGYFFLLKYNCWKYNCDNKALLGTTFYHFYLLRLQYLLQCSAKNYWQQHYFTVLITIK